MDLIWPPYLRVHYCRPKWLYKQAQFCWTILLKNMQFCCKNHWKICNCYDIETSNKWCEHKSLYVVDTPKVTILWDFCIRTDSIIQAKRSYIVVKQKPNKIYQLRGADLERSAQGVPSSPFFCNHLLFYNNFAPLPLYFCNHLFFYNNFEEPQTVLIEVKLITSNLRLRKYYQNIFNTQ